MDAKTLELKKSYDIKYAEAQAKSKEDEKNAFKDYNEHSDMTKEEISKKIIQIRKQLELQQDDILEEKIESLKDLDELYKEKVKDFVSDYEFDQYIKMVWNSAKSSYEAVSRN